MILEAKGLGKTYYLGKKELPVLKGIDLKVEKGEIVSIVGPSGAGKSTLLHLLGGLDKPSRGEVFLEGVNIYKLKPEKRAMLRNGRIGFIFQFYHLLPEFTAIENVILPGLIALGRRQYSLFPVSSRDKQNRRHKSKTQLTEYAYKLLEGVGLKERANHTPGKLSGGEQQRVAIARALINEPDILFCDEPTGNLDSKTGQEICDLLWKLNREKKQTLVIVTHEESITRGSDRVIHIRDGRLITERASG